MTRRVAASVVAISFALITSVGARQSRATYEVPTDLVSEWLNAVHAHEPGTADAAAVRVAKWWPTDMRNILNGVIAIARAVREGNVPDRRATNPSLIRFGGRSYTPAQLRALLHLSPADSFVIDPLPTLMRGANLHADVAMLVSLAPEMPHIVGPGMPVVAGTITGSDGGSRSEVDNSQHWRFARVLADVVLDDPARRDQVLQWYRATSAWQANDERWYPDHAEHACRLFPTDSRLRFYVGVVREVLASPDLQATRESSERQGLGAMINDARAELDAALVSLRQAVTLDPSFALARLHYGRVLGVLGRHEEANRELQVAAAGLSESAETYFVSLFLGYELGALGRRDDAEASFRRAASTFVRAQSPWLGLSQLARQFDDVAAARDALNHLLALPEGDDERQDPWWTYSTSHARDAMRLMDDVHRAAGQR